MKIRQALQHFTKKMEIELIANDHKLGWLDSDEIFLLDKLAIHQKKLFELIAKNGFGIGAFDDMEVQKRCVNIANFAMMISDIHDKKIGN